MEEHMKKYYFTFAFLLAGVVCGVAYNLIGSEIASDGILIEPFYLIPMFYLFLFAGLIGIVVIVMSRFRKRS
jgi:prepilin signal peptidase PulO-like enzyme (type II secretory pathway)